MFGKRKPRRHIRQLERFDRRELPQASRSGFARAPATRARSTGERREHLGHGSTEDPFVAPCAHPQNPDCSVTAFPGRSLTGLWANEYVPAYRCPDDHPFLLNQNYAPLGTHLPPGVEIQQSQRGVPGDPWQIGVTIVGASVSDTHPFLTGTKTGSRTRAPRIGIRAPAATGSSSIAQRSGVGLPLRATVLGSTAARPPWPMARSTR